MSETPMYARTRRPFPLVPGGVSDPEVRRVQSIVQAACDVCGVTKSELCSERRSNVIVKTRQMVHWIACRCTSALFPEIGRRLGGQDHSTVIHGFRKMDERLETDTSLAFEIQSIILRAMAIEHDAARRVEITAAEMAAQTEPEPEPEVVPVGRIHELRSRGYKARTIAVFTGVSYQTVAKELGLLREVA